MGLIWADIYLAHHDQGHLPSLTFHCLLYLFFSLSGFICLSGTKIDWNLINFCLACCNFDWSFLCPTFGNWLALYFLVYVSFVSMWILWYCKRHKWKVLYGLSNHCNLFISLLQGTCPWPHLHGSLINTNFLQDLLSKLSKKWVNKAGHSNACI